MKVLVSDSSILIEFSKRGLLGRMFQREFECAVPDLLFREELIDLGSHTRSDLLGLGLRVEALDAQGVAVALAYQAERPALSLVDSFALALAAHQGWPLLTEDRAMRSGRGHQGHRTPGCSVDHRQPAGCRHSVGIAGRGCSGSNARRSKMSGFHIRVGCAHTAIGCLSRDIRLYTA